MPRRGFNIAVAASLAAFVTTVALWASSYRTAPTLPSQVDRGGWVLLNFRGQLVFLHHRASPAPPTGITSSREAIRSLRGTWGTSTVYLGRDQNDVLALVKVLVLDPDAKWDAATGLPDHIWSNFYRDVSVARGCRLNSGGGFGWRAVSVPAAFPRSREIGSVVQSVAVPHWFIAVLSSLLPVRWAWRRVMATRAARVGRCVRCGYDLRATPGRCPECGTAALQR